MAQELQENHENDGLAYLANAEYRDELEHALDSESQDALVAFFEKLHVADIADVIEQSDRHTRESIVKLWGNQIDALVLTELEVGVRAEILEYVPYSVLSRALEELDADELVYIIEDLADDKRETLLRSLNKIDREAVTQSLTFPEGSAGRLMQREFVLTPEHWDVGHIIDHMRASADLPEFFHSVYIVSPTMKPLGAVRLSKLMGSPRASLIKDLMEDDLHTFRVDTEQSEVAYTFNQYHILSAPVLDADGRIVGVIEIDDALEILDDEAEEDIKRLAGVGDEELSDSILETARLRFPWLAVNLVTSILASIVIAQFSATIEAVVALAVLMPIVASMGGNAGTQTLTVAVRALATKDITRANAMRIIRRELFVGLMNGIAFAILMGAVGYIWFGLPNLPYVLAMAMVVNLVVAGLAGILIPIALDKLKIDPALASGAFVTTVTDIVGFFVFLGLAATMLVP